MCILVATSGDTGKGALEGFRDVDHTKILVFYPKDGVSAIQELQMVTQEGDNVGVCSVVGNFDDAQTGVKQLFSDEKLREELAERGYLPLLGQLHQLGPGAAPDRLLHLRLLRPGAGGEDPAGATRSTSACPPATSATSWPPTTPRRWACPSSKLICASNSNNVLTDFLRTGVYDRNRTFYNTMSPSMDILISSNLERLLFCLSTEDDSRGAGVHGAAGRDRPL